MEAALRALLASYAPLTTLVGGSVAPRITWNELPQGSSDPYVWLVKVDGAPGYTFGGSDGLESSIVQINIRANSYASAIAVREAIKARLSGFRGTQAGIFFGAIALRGERQSSSKPTTTLYHYFELDFDIWASAA